MTTPPIGMRCTDCGCCFATVKAGDDWLCWECDAGEPCAGNQEVPAPGSERIAAAPESKEAPRGESMSIKSKIGRGKRIPVEVRRAIANADPLASHTDLARKYGVSDVSVRSIRIATRTFASSPSSPPSEDADLSGACVSAGGKPTTVEAERVADRGGEAASEPPYTHEEFLNAVFRRLSVSEKWTALKNVLVPLVLLIATFCASPSAHAQTVTMTASKLSDGGALANGLLVLKPALATGQSASYRQPGGGIATVTPITVPVVNGAFAVSVPDTSLTAPSNICFSLVLSTANGSVLGPGFACVQPHGTPSGSGDWCQVVSGATVCNMDNLAPNLAAQVQVQMGPAGPAALPATTASIGGSPLTVGSCVVGTVTVSGAATGMAIAVTPVTFPGPGFVWNDAYVSAADTVTVPVCAIAAGTPTPSAYNVRVIQ